MEAPNSFKTLKADLLSGKYSTVDLVDYYLSRIHAFDGEIQSILTITDEIAFKKAKKADALIKKLKAKAFAEYPLLGVVVGYKDMFLKDGVRTTAGSRVLNGYVAQYSATAVEKLETAGAITIAKLNQDAWAHGASGENSDFFITKNPYDKARVAGGSSSGSAAAVASDFCLIALGTDTGGSVRQPASFTNLVGLKPTYGAISRWGVIAMSSSLDTVGVIGKNIADVKQTYDVLKGEDGHDSNVRLQTKSFDPGKKVTIGIPKEFFAERLDPEVKTKVEEVINTYQQMGHKIINISLPHTKYGISVYYIIQPAEVSSNLARYDGVRYGKDRLTFGSEAKRRIMLGSFVLSAGHYDAYYLKAMKVRNLIKMELEKAYEKVDVILAPVSPTPAFKIGEKQGDPISMYLSDIFTVTANLTGTPSVAIPGGFSKSGLPIGFQLMGPRFSEDLLFNLGQKYQAQTDWHTRKAVL